MKKSLEVPQGSLAEQFLPADYCDTFVLQTPADPPSPDQIHLRFWTSAPRWVDALMKLRNQLVRPFGLKGANEKQPSAEMLAEALRTGGSTGLLSVAAKNDDETVVLLTDKHLDAYISVRVVGRTVSVATLVRFRNRLGRVYFTLIRPFHAAVVCSTLKRVVR